ncbi:hypothetical protein Q1695_001969 [Nippostrongylus brasiliensis]|nr:hypothetical protein Q1695_001969 [Nippostrongylus brasiliensis]
MLAPLAKRARFSTENGVKALQQTVMQALLSDDKSCAALLSKLSGFEKEIVDALVVALKTFKDFKYSLSPSMLKVVADHFAAVGVGTTIERFNEFQNLLNEVGDEYVSNFAFLLEKLINHCQLLRHEKLFHEMCSRLPETISVLWKKNRRVEACRIARLYLETTLAAGCYRSESFPKLYFEEAITKKMKSCPYMKALTILQSPSVSGAVVIDSEELQDLPSSEIEPLCMRSQMADLVLTFLPSFCTHCGRKELKTLLHFLVLEYSRTNKISSLIRDVTRVTRPLTGDSAVWCLIFENLVQLLVDDLPPASADDDSLVNLLRSSLLAVLSMEESERSDIKLAKPIKRYFMRVKEKNKVFGISGESVIGALSELPSRAIRGSSSIQYSIVMLICASVSQSINSLLFATNVRILADLVSQADVRMFLKRASFVELIDFNLWIQSLEKADMSANWRYLVSFMSGLFGENENDSIAEENESEEDRLCPALEIFQAEDTECWSWQHVTRFMVLLSTTKWNKFLKCPEKNQGEVLAKIRNLYVAPMVSAAQWKDKDHVKSFAERWSVLFTCWEVIPRECRQPLMRKLLWDDEIKSIRKFSYRVLNGKYDLDKTIVDRAVTFQLKYLSGLTDGKYGIDSIIDWSVLVYQQSIGVPVSAMVSQLSVEKALELLSNLSEMEVTEDVLAVLKQLISTSLKDHVNDVMGAILPILENAEMFSRLMDCVISLIEVFSQTPAEHDIVTLCLSMISVRALDMTDSDKILCLQRVLQSTMHYAPSAVNNDQVAIFAQLFAKMLNAVQYFVMSKCGTPEQTEMLVHGANKLAHMVVQKERYFSRVVGSILAQVIKHYDKTLVAVLKLQTINDKFSSSMMATSLPPAERLQYKRAFQMFKNSMKPVV